MALKPSIIYREVYETCGLALGFWANGRLSCRTSSVSFQRHLSFDSLTRRVQVSGNSTQWDRGVCQIVSSCRCLSATHPSKTLQRNPLKLSAKEEYSPRLVAKTSPIVRHCCGITRRMCRGEQTVSILLAAVETSPHTDEHLYDSR